MQRSFGLFILGLAVCLAASAQERPDVQRSLVYSAKFVCKNVTAANDTTDVARAFGPGVYRTVLNLQNLSRSPAELQIIVTEATGIDAPGRGDAARLERRLAPGEASFVSCRAIHRLLNDSEAAPRKIDGFITVESNRRLAAAAVYSAVTRKPDIPNDGITLDVEHLRARVRRTDGSVDAE